MVSFRVYGEVLGKPRPRVNKNGRVWTPKKFKDYEKKIAEEYVKAGGKLIEGEVGIEIEVHRQLPKSRPKKIQSEPDTFKPDVDNIVKLILDALNGVAYNDDKQVTSIEIHKVPRKRIEEYVRISVREKHRNNYHVL